MSMSCGPISVSVSEDRLSETHTNKNRVVVEYMAKQTSFLIECKDSELTPSIQIQELLDIGEYYQIYDQYLIKYIDYIICGMQLSVEFIMTSK